MVLTFAVLPDEALDAALTLLDEDVGEGFEDVEVVESSLGLSLGGFSFKPSSHPKSFFLRLPGLVVSSSRISNDSTVSGSFALVGSATRVFGGFDSAFESLSLSDSIGGLGFPNANQLFLVVDSLAFESAGLSAFTATLGLVSLAAAVSCATGSDFFLSAREPNQDRLLFSAGGFSDLVVSTVLACVEPLGADFTSWVLLLRENNPGFLVSP